MLKKEAEVDAISLNSKVNMILKDYVNHWKWTKQFGLLTITSQTLSRLIENVPDDKVVEQAKLSGSLVVQDHLRARGIVVSFETVIDFIENCLDKHCHWFDFNKYSDGKRTFIHLRHNLGKKWSLFISTQVSTTFQYLLHIKTKTEIMPDNVTIEILN